MKDKLFRFRKDFLAIFVLFLLISVFLNKGFTNQAVFFGADEISSDLLHFSYPYREFWAEDYLKKGEIPLWNPYLESGLPFLAEAQTGIFFPLNIIFYLLFPPVAAFNLLIISCFLLLGLGTYIYARVVGLARVYSLYASTIFIFSGFMVGHLRHVPIITSIVVFPYCLVAIEKLIDTGRLRWCYLLAVFFAGSMLAGHLTTSYLVIFVASFYFVFRIYFHFKAKNEENIKPLLLFCVSVFVAIALAAVQLLPSAELISYSNRSTPEANQKLANNYSYKMLLLFINPKAFGLPQEGSWNFEEVQASGDNYWENIGYVGILPLLLAFSVIFLKKGKKDKSVKMQYLMVTLSFVLVLGAILPIYTIFINIIPGFSFTRISARFLFFVDFFLSLLAAFGLMYWVERSKKWGTKLILPLIFAISLVDLFRFGYAFNAVMPASYFREPDSVRYIKRDNDIFRVKADLDSLRDTWDEAQKQAGGWLGDLSSYQDQRNLLPPDYNLLYRIPSTSLIYAFSAHFSPQRPGQLDSIIDLALAPESLKDDPMIAARLMSVGNVKYLLSTKHFDQTNGLELKETFNKDTSLAINLYENKKYLPRAFLVGKVKTIEKFDELLDYLVSPDFDPTKEVLVGNSSLSKQTSGEGSVKIIEYQDNKVVLTVDSKEGGYLVLSDTFYPGWYATEDGQKKEIYQSNFAYRTIFVSPGSHEVIFGYDPISFKIGYVISLGTLALMTFSAFMLFVFKKRLL